MTTITTRFKKIIVLKYPLGTSLLEGNTSISNSKLAAKLLDFMYEELQDPTKDYTMLSLPKGEELTGEWDLQVLDVPVQETTDE